MVKNVFSSISLWNSVLLVSVVFTVFIIPVFPVTLHRGMFNISYSAIFLSAVLSLEKRSKTTLTIFVITFLMQILSSFLKLELINDISKSFNALFFIVVVYALIRQIASAREVSAEVILGSVSGYLLIAIVFTIFLFFISRNLPDAYTVQFSNPDDSSGIVDTSVPFYYTLITMASVRYGDIVPLKPVTRSMATLMGVTGQFYIAVIVAMLVGKFSLKK
jgi:hypothetical protein